MQLLQKFKKIVLFLFGVILIISGYKINASHAQATSTNDENDKTGKGIERKAETLVSEDNRF